MEPLSDEELIAQYLLTPAADRSRRLLDELFRRHSSRVVAWCYRLTGDRDRAPDLAQDVFVKAYASLHLFRRDSKFTTWLYSIARNRCRDDARTRAARWREVPDDTTVEPPSELNEALAALDARDARHAVQLVSLGIDGFPAGGSVAPSISGDGRFVLGTIRTVASPGLFRARCSRRAEPRPVGATPIAYVVLYRLFAVL